MRSTVSIRNALIVAVVAVFVLVLSLARFYTDVLWFREIGLTSVLFKSLSTQFLVGLAVGVAVALIVWGNLLVAARLAPEYRIPRIEVIGREDPLERYREVLTPYLRWLRAGVAVAIGIVAGLGAATAWQTFLLWANRVPFGVRDPQFGRDIGFYVFEIPFLTTVLDWAWFAFLAAVVTTIAAHLLHGAIRPEAGLSGVTPRALGHVSVLFGVLALIKAGQYYLGTFQLNFSERGTVTGASYTDVHAQLPALRLLAIISIVSALLFLVNIYARRAVLPLAAVGIWILTAVLAGGVWPWWVQRFSVDPQELQRERVYIQRNLEATRAAFAIEDVEIQEFAATTDLATDQIENNESLLQNVRLWDPTLLQQANSQLQAIRTYYTFEDVDVDRYEIDGELRQVLLSARELSIGDLPERSQTWANRHLQYTHGYGLVASLANARTPAGQPEFLVRNVPGVAVDGAETLFPEDQPRLYYGESFGSDEFSVVNTEQDELDYPGARSNYEGSGGIQAGSLLRKVLFAVREFDPNLVLSNLIREDSQILLYRNVRDRVLRAAPFLALDHDPYPAIVDGRIVWIMDAYTSSSFYPYSQRFDFRDIVGRTEAGTLSGAANYVRNPVKIVVDAYEGDMTFYVVDDSDPIIRAWMGVFPELFTTDEPSDDLRAHFRYPEDYFKIQTDVYLTYHMESPEDFYAREDEWAVPNQPGAATNDPNRPARMPPTYLLVSLPGDEEQEFVLTRPFTPRARNVMISFMLAHSDPDVYGKLSLLQFPSSRPPLGPSQIDNLINQEVEISETLTLLRTGGSSVDFGSLVVLPIEESILYVQPLFVTASNGAGQTATGIPELKRVILVYGERVVIDVGFDEALARLFDLEAPDAPPVAGAPPAEGDEEPPEEAPAPTGRLGEIVEEAGQVYERAQQALSRGDFEAYGRLIRQLGRLLEEAQTLSGG